MEKIFGDTECDVVVAIQCHSLRHRTAIHPCTGDMCAETYDIMQ